MYIYMYVCMCMCVCVRIRLFKIYIYIYIYICKCLFLYVYVCWNEGCSKSSKPYPERGTIAEHFCCGHTLPLLMMLEKIIKIFQVS